MVTTRMAWALAPVFIRFLRDAYDPYSQSFIRYLGGTLGLLAVCWVRYRPELLRLLRDPRTLVGIALLNVVQQCTWTIGCYGSTATMAQLITKLNVVFVIIFSFFLFHEERAVIRSPFFLVGTLLSFGGGAVLLTRDAASLAPALDRSTVLLLVTALLWGVYIVWAKHLVANTHPAPMFAVVAIFTTAGLGVTSLLLGDPACMIRAGPRTTAIALISGLLPIGAGHPAFHYAQRRLGSALSSSCNLLTPFLTFVLAMMILDDAPLTPRQWMGAGVLVAGTLLVVWAGQRAHRRNEATSSVEADKVRDKGPVCAG